MINYYTDTREDTLDEAEYALYQLIMDYRASLGLPSIPLSKALTITASRHVLDTVYNLGGYDGHNWSDAPYDANDPSTYPNMWFAPDRLGTGYGDPGFEISIGYIADPDPFTVPDMTPETALTGWQGSPPHNDVIVQQGPWQDDWQAIGIAIHESVSHVWFGRSVDPTGAPVFAFDIGSQDNSGNVGGGDVFEFIVSSNGNENATRGETYDGPVGYLELQLLLAGDNDVVTGTSRNDFINSAGGTDAIDAGAGNDVLDGGTGSNFLTGGRGDDIFFTDARIPGLITWSTITDFDPGVEEATIWGWRPGVSEGRWAATDGANGFQGATFHADVDGDGTTDTSITFSGLSQGDVPEPAVLDGLLWFA